MCVSLLIFFCIYARPLCNPCTADRLLFSDKYLRSAALPVFVAFSLHRMNVPWKTEHRGVLDKKPPPQLLLLFLLLSLFCVLIYGAHTFSCPLSRHVVEGEEGSICISALPSLSMQLQIFSLYTTHFWCFVMVVTRSFRAVRVTTLKLMYLYECRHS